MFRKTPPLAFALSLLAMTGCSKLRGAGGTSGPGGASGSASAMVITTPFASYCEEGLDKCEADCNSGTREQCRKLAGAYEFGKGGATVDETRATALFDKACNLGDAISCVSAGRMYEYKHGVPKDDSRAALLYDKACQMNDVSGCYNKAIMLQHGRGVPEDKAAATEIFGRLCDAGSQASCGQIGAR